jgi:hypothetical protein
MARSSGAAVVTLVVLAFLVASAGNSFDDHHDRSHTLFRQQPSIRLSVFFES